MHAFHTLLRNTASDTQLQAGETDPESPPRAVGVISSMWRWEAAVSLDNYW